MSSVLEFNGIEVEFGDSDDQQNKGFQILDENTNGGFNLLSDPDEKVTINLTEKDGDESELDPGDDNVFTGIRDDVVFAGKGNDIIGGGDGEDTIFGQAGDDVLRGNEGNDVLNGGGGRDAINGGAGNDFLNGGAGNDLLYGGTGDDIINGGAGNDIIRGEEGDDIIKGGAGRDTIYGGAGADFFQFHKDDFANSEIDKIMDFEVGVDSLQISGIDPAKVEIDGKEIKYNNDTIIRLNVDLNDIEPEKYDDTFELF